MPYSSLDILSAKFQADDAVFLDFIQLAIVFGEISEILFAVEAELGAFEERKHFLQGKASLFTVHELVVQKGIDYLLKFEQGLMNRQSTKNFLFRSLF